MNIFDDGRYGNFYFFFLFKFGSSKFGKDFLNWYKGIWFFWLKFVFENFDRVIIVICVFVGYILFYIRKVVCEMIIF